MRLGGLRTRGALSPRGWRMASQRPQEAAEGVRGPTAALNLRPATDGRPQPGTTASFRLLQRLPGHSAQWVSAPPVVHGGGGGAGANTRGRRCWHDRVNIAGFIPLAPSSAALTGGLRTAADGAVCSTRVHGEGRGERCDARGARNGRR